MKESTKAYLVDIYNSIPKKTKATCLKFYYQYHNVNVNVYFDAFDNQSVVLSIVLSAKKKYYYTPLNILNTGMITEYLSEIPPQILEKILVDNHLDDFYENMEKHLLEDKPHFNYYNEDTYFVNTIKYAKSKLDLPFWWYLRKVPMSDDTLYKLNATQHIPLSQAKAGDLVFFHSTYNAGTYVTHVGIYAGNNRMYHAGDPIGYADLTSSYWQQHLIGAGRVKTN